MIQREANVRSMCRLRVLCVWLVTAAATGILLQSTALATDADCGKPTGVVFDGHKVLSNGRRSPTGGSCGGRGPYGPRYQCTEYVKRFFDEPDWNGHARDYFETAEAKGFQACPDGQTTVRPESRDILVFDRGSKGFGHVAIIETVTVSESGAFLDIVEQNFGRGRRRLPLVNKGGLWTIGEVGKLVTEGWLRQSSNPPPRFPRSLTQSSLRDSTITPVPIGGTTLESTMVFSGRVEATDKVEGRIADSRENELQLEVEVRPVGVNLTGTPNSNCTSSRAVPSGLTTVSLCSELPPGAYHWQARSRNRAGGVSCWISAGANSENSADFIVCTPDKPRFNATTGQCEACPAGAVFDPTAEGEKCRVPAALFVLNTLYNVPGNAPTESSGASNLLVQRGGFGPGGLGVRVSSSAGGASANVTFEALNGICSRTNGVAGETTVEVYVLNSIGTPFRMSYEATATVSGSAIRTLPVNANINFAVDFQEVLSPSVVKVIAAPGTSDAQTRTVQAIESGTTSRKVLEVEGRTYSLARVFSIGARAGGGGCFTCDVTPMCCDCGLAQGSVNLNLRVLPPDAVGEARK